MRTLIIGCWMALFAPPLLAQSIPPTAPGYAGPVATSGFPVPADDSRNTVTVYGGWLNTLDKMREQREKLAAQLADPQQRAQVLGLRVQLLRVMHPDLARCVGLEADGEQQLLALLADQQLTAELEPNSFESRPFIPRPGVVPRESPLQPQAGKHTQQMDVIARMLSSAQMERYLDYRVARESRLSVQSLDSALPPEHKLTSEQKDGMVSILQRAEQAVESSFAAGRRTAGMLLADMALSMPERMRRMQRDQIARQEARLVQLEARHRQLRERLRILLTATQTAQLDDQQQRIADGLRASIAEERSKAGIGPEVVLEPARSDAMPVPDVRFDVDISIDDWGAQSSRDSRGGRRVVLAGPGGLLLELQPLYANEAGEVIFDLEVYERVQQRKRLVGKLGAAAVITNPAKAPVRPLLFRGPSTSSTVLLGRRGYVVGVTATATLQ